MQEICTRRGSYKSYISEEENTWVITTCKDNLVREAVVHYIRASVTDPPANSSEPPSRGRDS